MITTVARLDAYAGAASRAVAYMLDALIVSILAGAAVVGMGVMASVMGSTARDVTHAVVSSYVVIAPSLMAVYCALFWTLAGRTPGMAALGLRVVTMDGRRVGSFAAIIRAVVLVCFPIGAVLIVVDRRHQAVHDKIARTVVIR